MNFRWFIILALFVVGLDVRAQSREEFVVSAGDGGSPYMLVFKDERGGSRRDPGIYVRGEDSDWVLAFPGKILQKPVSGGLSLLLHEMTAISGNHEAIAVIDGKIVLFDVHSRHDDPNTYLVLGEGAAEVRHPVSGERIQVPLIENLENLELHEEQGSDQHENHLHMVLFSIRSDRVPSGDGLTIGMTIDVKNTLRGEGNFHLRYNPVLLDWSCDCGGELANRVLSLDDSAGFISRLATVPFTRVRPFDPPLMKYWRGLLADFSRGDITLRDFERKTDLKKAGAHLSDTLPYIDIGTGLVNMNSLPRVTFDLMGDEAWAVFDPEGAHGGIFYSEDEVVPLSKLPDQKPLIGGNPILDEHHRVKFESLTAGNGDSFGLMFMADGKIYVFHSGQRQRGEPDFFLLEPTEKEFLRQRPDDFSWHYDEKTGILLCSWKFDDDVFTSAYRFQLKGPRVTLAQEATLHQEFYNKVELGLRFKVFDNGMAFDHTTPHSSSPEEYAQRYRKTALHLEVNRQLRSGESSPIFLEPISEKLITENLVYRTYETIPNVASKTGIYLMGGTKEEREHSSSPLMAGEAVQSPAFDSEVLLSFTLDTQQKNLGSVDVSAVLVDPHMHAGKSSFLMIFFNPTDGTAATTSTPASKRAIDSSNLLSFGFIDPVRLKGENEKEKQKKYPNGILIAYFTYKDPAGGAAYTAISEIQYERKGEKGIEITSVTERVVEGADLTAEEIQSRILFDEHNRAYWVKTPDRDRHDDKFHVVSIQSGKDVRPQRDRTIRLRSLKDEDKEHEREILRGSWRVSDSIGYKDEEAEKIRNWYRNAPEFQADVFPQLRELLDSLSNVERPARHVVLLVPEDLLNYVSHYPWALRYRESNRSPTWSPLNEHHQVFMPRTPQANDTVTQAEVFRNMAAMREIGARRRPMLLSTLERIRQLDRPVIDVEEQRKDGFHITKQVDAPSSIQFGEQVKHGNQEMEVPHALYLLATEGQRLDLPQFRPGANKRLSSMLLFGTPKQWEQLKAAAALENSYGLEKDFEVVELGPPTRQLRVQLALENVLRHPSIRYLNYTLDATGMISEDSETEVTPAIAEEKIMTHLVNRAEQLALDNQMPVFESFMKALNELSRQLTHNQAYRARRVIDCTLIEKVLSHVFPMPLNPNVLPEDDPLRILLRDDADFLWQKAGYAGPVSFKERIIKVILAQLAMDDVRSLKSSAIIYGPSGSSKTKAIDTLFNMLGLKRYEFHGDASENDRAWAFVLNMNNVFSGKSGKDQSGGAEKMMSFEEAKAHFDRFLASENGARGFIFLDDMHLAPDDVRAYFLKRIRSLQDAKTYKTAKGIERPTRNITIFVALNPTASQERIRRFAQNHQSPSDAEMVLAALSSGDSSNDIDRSYITRYGDLINLGRFPVSSKGPALLSTLVPARAANFANSQRIIFVSPGVIEDIIRHSPHSDARTFLSSASSGLMKVPRGTGHRLYVVTRRSEREEGRIRRADEEFNLAGGDEGHKIEDFILDAFQGSPVEEGYEGKFELLNYLATNFRLKFYELLLQSVSENRDFMKRPEYRIPLVLPLGLSLHRHLKENPEPYLDEMALDPNDLGASGDAQRHLFERALDRAVQEQLKNQRRPRPRLPIGVAPRRDILGSLGMGPSNRVYSRQDVLAETVHLLSVLMEDVMEAMLQIPSLERTPKAHEWLNQGFQDINLVEKFGGKINDIILYYFTKIQDPRLQAEGDGSTLSNYEAMRLLLMAIDKSISRLRWTKILSFLVNSLSVMSKDMSVGQSPQVQNLLFKNQTSIFTPMDLGLVLALSRSLPHFDEYSEAEVRWDGRFGERCNGLLSLAGGALQ